MFAAALVIGATMAGAASAQERVSSNSIIRDGDRVRVVQTRDGQVLVSGRCSGVECLRNVPSLGVAF